MKYSCACNPIENLTEDCVVFFTSTVDKATGRTLKKIDTATSGALSRLIESGEFTGKNGQIASLINPEGFKTSRLLLLGLGEKKELSPDSFRQAMGTVSRYPGLARASKAAVHFGDYTRKDCFQAAAEGYLLGTHKVLDYKTGEGAVSLTRLKAINFVTEKRPALRPMTAAVERGQIIAEGQIMARTLAQMPAGDLTPIKLARKAQQLAKKHGLKCRILDEKEIEGEKMGAFLGVARGSVEPPRFLILEHRAGRAKGKPIVLVGKGVTFDSGGISLKPGLNMHEMKGDMQGSAVVLATMVTAARLKIKQNVVALIPACENMPSGHATRPGDILVSRKGLTIEDINTDAEGRLILADALDYANKFKPQAVIDIATLTGGAMYILGHAGAPIMGNDEKLLNRINDAGEATAERVWPMPIWEDHRKQMKSSLADLVNTGGRPASSITAAAFLENFAGDWPWGHIDIASVDVETRGKPYIPKGTTGIGMRLLTELLLSWRSR